MRRAWWLTVVVLALVAGGCRDRSGEGARPARTDGIVVSSFDFDESRLLAEIYAQALEDEGITVQRQLGMGPRELVLPAMVAGLVDVVPEYAGSALAAVDPGASADDVAHVVAALDRAVDRWALEVLSPASATNENVVVVAAELAEDHQLRRVSDLAPLASELVLGGPPECPERPRCLRGFEDRYGLQFAAFQPLAGADLVRQAIADDVVDVGVLFSTDAALTSDDLVALDDDLDLQLAEVVIPLVRSEVARDRRVRRTIDEVSAALTTENLRFLNWRLSEEQTDVAAEARGWLVRRELVSR